MTAKFEIFKDLDSLSLGAMEHVVNLLSELTAQRNAVSLVLAGGSTPKLLYKRLAENADLDWSKIHIFWSDERCVPLESPDSNYQMAYENLLSNINIPPGNVHVPPTNLISPRDIAAAYERDIREFFGSDSVETTPRFDVVLLGMGNDGHTASLFPNGSELQEQDKLVVVVEKSPTAPQVPRISLSLPVLQASRQIFILIAGESKQPIVDMIAKKPEEAMRRFPAAQVGLNASALWLLDDASAANMRPE